MDTRGGRPLDLTNLPVTCACNEAVGNFNTGIEAYVSLKENPTPWFEAALEIQKDLVIAHCLLVRYRYTYTVKVCLTACFSVTGLLSIIRP